MRRSSRPAGPYRDRSIANLVDGAVHIGVGEFTGLPALELLRPTDPIAQGEHQQRQYRDAQ